MSELFYPRNDMALPCRDCRNRYPGCREKCQDPQFLEGMRMRRLADQDRERRMAAAAVDRRARMRRGCVAACEKKGRK